MVQGSTKDITSQAREGEYNEKVNETISIVAAKTTEIASKTWGIMKGVVAMVSQNIKAHQKGRGVPQEEVKSSAKDIYEDGDVRRTLLGFRSSSDVGKACKIFCHDFVVLEYPTVETGSDVDLNLSEKLLFFEPDSDPMSRQLADSEVGERSLKGVLKSNFEYQNIGSSSVRPESKVEREAMKRDVMLTGEDEETTLYPAVVKESDVWSPCEDFGECGLNPWDAKVVRDVIY
ncbi:hypothetical protein SUGI_0082230 [Cryptomeria japonica]|nr:hypothetical protein SUGI_0082230 [Cryptomeria japonica]